MTTERLLRKASQALGTAGGTVLLTALTLTPVSAQSQQYAVSDSQLQSNVSTALRNDAKLDGIIIKTSANQGVVTLTGSVSSEDVRTEAEQVVAGVSGVRSIQDNVDVIGGGATAPAPATAQGNQQQPETAQQADGANTMPPPPPPDPAASTSQGATTANGMPPAPPADQQYTPYPNGSASQTANAQQPYGNQQYPAQQGQYGNPQQYPQQGQYGNQQPGYGYGNEGGYGPRGNAHPPVTLAVSPQQQDASGPVTIPAGTLLSVRTEQPLSTGALRGGEYFQATAATDVYANGVVAIPRGTVLNGQVVEAKNAGAFGGSPKLDLKLTSIQLGPTTYPLISEVWSSQGPSKTGYTATNAAGGAIVGALIGAVAGGGVGAGVGAIAGGTGGALISGATHGPRLDLPPEALLQFHLAEPVTVQPLKFNEAEQIAASAPAAQPVLHQRPVYYAAPYPRPYPYYAYPYAVRPYPY